MRCGGRSGEGGGAQYSPIYVRPLIPHRVSDSPAPGGLAESCSAINSGEALAEEGGVPAPTRGVMFCRCCVCGTDIGSQPVERGSAGDGATSHGYCEPHYQEAMREVEELRRRQERRLEIESYLYGLGLTPQWWVVVLVPWALLAAAGGAR